MISSSDGISNMEDLVEIGTDLFDIGSDMDDLIDSVLYDVQYKAFGFKTCDNLGIALMEPNQILQQYFSCTMPHNYNLSKKYKRHSHKNHSTKMTFNGDRVEKIIIPIYSKIKWSDRSWNRKQNMNVERTITENKEVEIDYENNHDFMDNNWYEENILDWSVEQVMPNEEFDFVTELTEDEQAIIDKQHLSSKKYLYRWFAVDITPNNIDHLSKQMSITQHAITRFKQRISTKNFSGLVRRCLLFAMQRGIWIMRCKRWGGGKRTIIIYYKDVVYIIDKNVRSLVTCWNIDSDQSTQYGINHHLLTTLQTSRFSKISLRA
eukprot:410856_1